MVSFPVLRAVAGESLKSLSDAFVLVTRGKAAVNQRRVNRLIELLRPTFVEAEALASSPKFTQIKSDVAEMAAKIGLAPPEILVTNQPLAMMAPSEKVLLLAEEELVRSTSKELRALAGHELGHIQRGDHLNFDRPPNHTQELAADRLGIELSGEPEAMVSWLERRAKEDPISAKGTLVYPPIAKRIEEIINAGKSQTIAKIEQSTSSRPIGGR